MQGREDKKLKKDSPLRRRYLFHLTGNIKETKCFTTSLHKFIIMLYISPLQNRSEEKHDFSTNKLFFFTSLTTSFPLFYCVLSSIQTF